MRQAENADRRGRVNSVNHDREKLFESYLDGDLAPAQAAELAALLENEPDARADLLRFVLLETQLTEALLASDEDRASKNSRSRWDSPLSLIKTEASLHPRVPRRFGVGGSRGWQSQALLRHC